MIPYFDFILCLRGEFRLEWDLLDNVQPNELSVEITFEILIVVRSIFHIEAHFFHDLNEHIASQMRGALVDAYLAYGTFQWAFVLLHFALGKAPTFSIVKSSYEQDMLVGRIDENGAVGRHAQFVAAPARENRIEIVNVISKEWTV